MMFDFTTIYTVSIKIKNATDVMAENTVQGTDAFIHMLKDAGKKNTCIEIIGINKVPSYSLDTDIPIEDGFKLDDELDAGFAELFW